MFTFVPVNQEEQHCPEPITNHDFYSVEFGLDGSHPVYQFKLWHLDQTDPFFVLKNTSALAKRLNVGDVMPMKYYYNEMEPAVEHHQTRIKEIVNEKDGRFEGHYRIELNILNNDMAEFLQPICMD